MRWILLLGLAACQTTPLDLPVTGDLGTVHSPVDMTRTDLAARVDMELVDVARRDMAQVDLARDDMARVDLATSPIDLSQPDGDVSGTNRMGCAWLIKCSADCDTMCGTDLLCSGYCNDGCGYSAGNAAQRLLNNAIFCEYDFCLAADGSRPPRCVQASRLDPLRDPPGAPPGTCDHCRVNATASLLGYSCSPLNDPDCNPAQCQSAVMMCLQN